MPTAFKNSKGLTRYKFTLEEIEEASENQQGFCIACGEARDSCEPDARHYDCDNCGQYKVFGVDELAIMGYVI